MFWIKSAAMTLAALIVFAAIISRLIDFATDHEGAAAVIKFISGGMFGGVLGIVFPKSKYDAWGPFKYALPKEER